MSEARQRRFVRTVALVVLLGAILPNVIYLGHWSIPGLPGTAAATAAHSHDDGHADHCHGSSSCSSQAVYGLKWWITGDGALTLDGGLERTEAVPSDVSHTDPLIDPLDPPPRYA